MDVCVVGLGKIGVPLAARIARPVDVCVVGLGKIGVPLAARIASLGHSVVGCDIDPAVVESVNRGACPIAGEDGLDEMLRACVAEGRLTATTDTAAGVRASEAVAVIVPAFLTTDRQADLSAVDAAARAIAGGLTEGTLVVFETTLPVGTTCGRLGPILSGGSGLEVGEGFLLAFSPERISSGSAFADLESYPKVVGADDERSAEAAARFYGTAVGVRVLPVATTATAELVKLMELTYRDVNIALANELALCAERAGVDVTEAIAAANSQPHAHVHAPGIGVGGHCVPVNPWFLIKGAGPAPLAELARRINDDMPSQAVRLLERSLGGVAGRTILVLGLAYRANVKESYHSTAIQLAEALSAAGARVLVNDPLFSHEEIIAQGMTPTHLEPLPAADAVVLQAYHDLYRSLDMTSFPGCRVVLDGRNVLCPDAVTASGVTYVGIGR